MVQIKECDLRLREISFSVSSSSLVLVLVLGAKRFRIEDEHENEGRGRFCCPTRSRSSRIFVLWGARNRHFLFAEAWIIDAQGVGQVGEMFLLLGDNRPEHFA